MCELCVKEEYPDRGSFCLESGTYLVNLKACQGCGKKDSLIVTNLVVQSVDEVETTQYEHKCSECSHFVAKHEHRFWVEEDFQYYEMNCLLCGEAEDSRSCLPDDPRCILNM